MSDYTYKIGTLLSSSQFRTGTELGCELSISRSAVWKIIKKLRQYGVNITSDKKLGYKLVQELCLIDQAKIQKAIFFGNVQVDVLESVNSTNEYLKMVDSSKFSNYVCLAEHQSSGKGRLQRSWHSPFSQNIYCSMTHVFKKDISALAGLSMVVSLSILKTLLHFIGPSQDLKIKWPNDVYFEDRKISGVIVETIGESHGGCKAIIGIGINVNMMEGPNNSNWTSLKKIATKDFDRNEICILLINNLISDIKEFETHGFARSIEKWNQHDYLSGKVISIKNYDQIVTGVYKGISSTGHLLLQTEEGNTREFSSGDTTTSF